MKGPITVAARSMAWNVFARSKTGIVDSIPTWGMDACLRLFCVYVLNVKVVALRRADPPSKAYRLCKRSRNWNSAKVQKNVVDPQIDRQIDREKE
jgi:hypothetical protein